MRTIINNFRNQMEFNRYGIMPIILIVQCCYASVAICYICAIPIEYQIIPLSFVSVSTMTANAVTIMLLPMKWVMRFFFTSVIVSTAMLVYALILF